MDPLPPDNTPANSSFILPPIGTITDDPTAHTNAVSYLAGLAQESRISRDQYVEVITANRNFFQEGSETIPGETDIVVNQLQNDIIGTVDVQTKDPPTASIEPVETGEPPEYYWAGPPQVAQALGLDPSEYQEWDASEIGDGSQMMPPNPLDPFRGEALSEAATMGQVVPTAMGPVALKEDWVVAVNDELVADVYQTVFDVKWARGRLDKRLRRLILWTNIDGFVLWLYLWDPATKVPTIKPLSPQQVFIDPTVEDIEDAAYAGIDVVLDAGVAKTLYPQIADRIDEYAKPGNPDFFAESEWGQASQRDFRRLVVTMRTFWLRNQPCPMTVEQAVGMGVVVVGPAAPAMGEVSDEDPASSGDAGGFGGGVAGAGLQPLRVGQSGQSPLDAGPGETMGQVQDGVGPPAFFLADTGAEVAPGGPGWPTYPCIRQISVILSAVVADEPCPHWDIPLLHNVNIPVQDTPWGIGEPYRIKRVQAARNRQLTAIVDHTDLYRTPPAVLPESAAKRLEEEFGDAYIRPGTPLIIDDQMYKDFNGQINSFMTPPALPPALVDAESMLKDIQTDLSGYAEVLRGQANAQDSGEKVKALQEAAASMIGYKSQGTGDLVWRLARLILHNLHMDMSVQDLLKIVSKYPPHVMAALKLRGMRLDWDVNVTVASGSGVVKQNKQQQAINMYEARLQSRETTQEAVGIDPRLEQQRQGKEQAEMAVAAAKAGVQPGPQKPAKGGGE